MVKITKSVSISPKLVMEADKLVQKGEIPSFSWLVGKSVENELKKFRDVVNNGH